ncbi:MAG: hypothetical protein IK081_07645 [Lachnospiraceae bacterium]|nr:hypothetical protein [Lachnospiraceae bacterium]
MDQKQRSKMSGHLSVLQTYDWEGMMKKNSKLLIIWMLMMTLLSGCIGVGSVTYDQETESSQEAESVQVTESSQEAESIQATESAQGAESSQAAGMESPEDLIQYEVEDTLSLDRYEAFYRFVSKSRDDEWASFQCSDFDGKDGTELFAVKNEPDGSEEGKRRYFVIYWEDQKLIVTEMDPSAKSVHGGRMNQMGYETKDSILDALFERIPDKERQNELALAKKQEEEQNLFHLIVDLVWIDDNWSKQSKESCDAIKDYLVVSNLGEKINYQRSNKTFRHRMPITEVTEFYKEILGIERQYDLTHDSTSEVGVRRINEYLYAYNGVGWGDYAEIKDVERRDSEVIIHATIMNAYTDERMAEMTVNLTPDDGKYEYKLQGYEVSYNFCFDPETGKKLEEFKTDDLRIQYFLEEKRSAGGTVPVIKNLCFRENDEKQFTANAKKLLTELKKEYNANPGSDGSNIAVKSTLLAEYEFANNSIILIYEDAVYGKVPPQTGNGSEYGYYLNYYVLTPGNVFESGELFHYNESFGKMPADRKGSSRCCHYFLGNDPMGNLKLDGYKYVAQSEDFSKETMFYASIGRSHDMTFDENGGENYDEDYYVYGAFFYPDGSRFLNLYDTWQVATLNYISNGFFLKTPDGVPLFEERVGTWDSRYYVEGKGLTYKQMIPNTTETFCDVTLGAKAKLIGQIERWSWTSGRITVNLVFRTDDAEVSFNLYDYEIYW